MLSKAWMRLPSRWIERGGLRELSWRYQGEGADNIAALMALTAIAHAADDETGIAQITYDRACEITELSRAKLSRGLGILKRIEVVRSGPGEARSKYQLIDYDPAQGWAKFPVKSMYSAGRITAFSDFHLRKRVELDALKLFFLFVSRRNQHTNLANIGYDRIEKYSGVRRDCIKPAISFLASLSLVYVEQAASQANEHGISNAYRIVGIDPRIHMGTRARSFPGLLDMVMPSTRT